MPVLAGPGLHQPAFGRFFHQAAPGDFDLEHQRLDVAGDHQVAATAQHKTGRVGPLRRAQQHLHVGAAAHAHQLLRAGGDTEAVVWLERHVVLD